MNKKDPNYIVKLERIISQRYGEETIANPKDNWDDNKEQEYFRQLKELEEKEEDKGKNEEEFISEGNILIDKKIKENKDRICLKCNEYSFKKIDDIYMIKYQCCYKCYLKYYDHPNFNKK